MTEDQEPVGEDREDATVDRTLAAADRALELARRQVEVLTELTAADRRGDDAAARRWALTLDRVMADVLRVDEARRAGGHTDESSDELELACSACGAAALPMYDTPRLRGYTCPQCGWTGHDPVAMAAEKVTQAMTAAAETVGPVAATLSTAAAELQQRRKATRLEGLRAVEDAHHTLADAAERVRRAEEQLAREQHGERSDHVIDGAR